MSDSFSDEPNKFQAPSSNRNEHEQTRLPHPTALAFSEALDLHLNDPPEKTEEQSQRSKNANKGKKIRNDILQISMQLGWRNRHAASLSYPIRLEVEGSPKKYSVRQIPDRALDYGTGVSVWPASLVLLHFLERHPDIIRGRTVLDLGAGTGVTSIGTAYLGASLVVCTDGEKSVVDLAKQNAKKFDNVRTCAYRWGVDSEKLMRTHFSDPTKIGCQKCSKPNVVLVGDCVLPRLYPIEPLVQALLECSDNSTTTFLSYEQRFYEKFDPKVQFKELANRAGLAVIEVPRKSHHHIYQASDIEIWKVTLR